MASQAQIDAIGRGELPKIISRTQVRHNTNINAAALVIVETETLEFLSQYAEVQKWAYWGDPSRIVRVTGGDFR